MKKDKVIFIAIIALVAIFLYKYLPLIIVAGVVIYAIKRTTTKELPPPPRRRPVEEYHPDNSVIQAHLQDVDSLIAEKNRVIRSTDLRQFKGRNDVTKEELARYMFEQRSWDGAYERRLQMEEIIKHCNLQQSDVEWVEQRLKSYTINGQKYKASLIRNDEAKAISEELKRIGREETYKVVREIHTLRTNAIRFEQDMDIPKTDGYIKMNEELDNVHRLTMQDLADHLQEYDYDTWLRMKGRSK